MLIQIWLFFTPPVTMLTFKFTSLQPGLLDGNPKARNKPARSTAKVLSLTSTHTEKQEE